jgi:glycosyltransferase involved in cell wall biosynthesis
MVVGPLSAVGGMASAMRTQLASSAARVFKFVQFDNSKRTPVDRPWWRGAASQCALFSAFVFRLLRRRPRIVHIHTCSGMTFFRNSIDCLAARMCGARVLLHIHGGRFEQFLYALGPVTRLWVRWVLRHCDRVVALSPAWVQRLQRFDPRIQFDVVHNGVEVQPVRSAVTADATCRLVMIGPLTRAKGIDDLLQALQDLPGDVQSRIELTVIGGDPQNRRAELERLASELRLKTPPRFLGEQRPDEVATHLQYADIFVLPSHSEGLPIAMLEAMAYELAIVATRVGAVPEVLEEGQAGVLVQPSCPQSLSSAIATLVIDAQRRGHLAAAGRQRIIQHYSAESVARRLQTIYQDLWPGAPS